MANEETDRDVIMRAILVEEIRTLIGYARKSLSTQERDSDTLKASLDFLKSQFNQLQELNEKIWLKMLEIQQLRVDRAQQNGLTMEIRLVMCNLQTAIDDAVSKKTTVIEKSEQTARCTDASKNARKLEPLKMDRFDGKLENWIPWWTRFEDCIHNDPQLNDRTKYDYLLQYLSREVKDKLRTIPIDETFYNAAAPSADSKLTMAIPRN